MNLSKDPKVMQRFMDYLARDIVRDEACKKMILLTGLSAYSKDPINLFLKGPSSIGKSFNVTNTLRFFGKDVLWLGGLSPTALVHEYGVLIDPETGEEVPEDWKDMMLEKLLEDNKLNKAGLSPEEKRKVAKLKKQAEREYREILRRSYYLIDLTGKILVFLEAPHPQTYMMLRPILSHDVRDIIFKFTDKVGRGTLRTKTVVLRGWPATIFCTSDPKYIEDLATRGFTITPEMSEEKYQEANVLFMKKKAFPLQLDKDLPTFCQYIGELKSFLSLRQIEVLTPFGPELAEAYPHTLARDMRDLPHFSALVDMFATFHAPQRPVLKVDGEPKAILTTREDFMRAYGVFRKFVETTRVGLPEHILRVFRDVMIPLSKEYPEGFTYEDLVKKHNEVFKGDYKSSKTLYDYVRELRAVGYVDTKPHPTAKRYKLIYVLKNPPDILSHLVGTLATSFSLEKLKKWWNTLRQRSSGETNLQLTFFDRDISLEDLYKNCYVISVPEEERHKDEISPKKASSDEREEPTFRRNVTGSQQASRNKSIDEMFNPTPLSFDALNLLDGPHQLVGEMYHEGLCYRCKQSHQISWYYSDFKGEKHDLCTECGWAVSKELEKRLGVVWAWNGFHAIGPYTPDVAYKKTVGSIRELQKKQALTRRDVEEIVAYYWTKESHPKVWDRLLKDGVVDKLEE